MVYKIDKFLESIEQESKQENNKQNNEKSNFENTMFEPDPYMDIINNDDKQEAENNFDW